MAAMTPWESLLPSSPSLTTLLLPTTPASFYTSCPGKPVLHMDRKPERLPPAAFQERSWQGSWLLPSKGSGRERKRRKWRKRRERERATRLFFFLIQDLTQERRGHALI